MIAGGLSALVSPKFQKRSALKFVGRTIPLAKLSGVVPQSSI